MRDPYDPIDEIEAMVLAAGQYVRASDDLRPRVLETARSQCGERRAQRCLHHFAVFIALLAFFTTIYHNQLEGNNPGLRDSVLAVISNRTSSPASPTVRSGNWDWSMIDAFTELRRQQAAVFRANL